MSDTATVKALLREIEELKAARFRDAVEVASTHRAGLRDAWEEGRKMGRYHYAYPENNPYGGASDAAV